MPRPCALPGLILAALLTVAAGALAAPPGEAPPEVQRLGGIPVVTGGSGEGARAALEQVAGGFSLQLTFAVQPGAEGRSAYLGDVRVELLDGAGVHLFETRTDGPLLYADPPPGRYTVVATRADGVSASRSVQVTDARPTRVLMRLGPAEAERSGASGVAVRALRVRGTLAGIESVEVVEAPAAVSPGASREQADAGLRVDGREHWLRVDAYRVSGEAPGASPEPVGTFDELVALPPSPAAPQRVELIRPEDGSLIDARSLASDPTPLP